MVEASRKTFREHLVKQMGEKRAAEWLREEYLRKQKARIWFLNAQMQQIKSSMQGAG